MSASDTCSNAMRTARLIKCQLLRAPQDCSISQRWSWIEHSVKAIGPSMASMMAVTEISAAGRASA